MELDLDHIILHLLLDLPEVIEQPLLHSLVSGGQLVTELHTQLGSPKQSVPQQLKGPLVNS